MANIRASDIDKKLLGLKVKISGIEVVIKQIDCEISGSVWLHFNYLDGTHCGLIFLPENQEIDIYGSVSDREMPQVVLDQHEEDAHEKDGK